MLRVDSSSDHLKQWRYCTFCIDKNLLPGPSPQTVYQSLVVVLVLSRLAYDSATLAGLPACQLNRLQSVLDAVARSIAGLRRSEHITDAVASLHWLRAPERIKFKLAVSHCLPSSSRHCTLVLVGPAAVRR